METGELARQSAATFHDQAVARGIDPWRPYEFAVTEAKRRGIDVEGTVPGGTMLQNARAAFIPADKLILHENVGTAFEQAFLIAHEIGHVEFGDDPDAEPVVNIDPARPAEPSPVGIDRVVDYSRRQRREVQMDLFAREFLLPRPFVRKLHLEDNMTASAIAERYGAPFDVVAQQLLDALLLPPIVFGAEAAKIERTPNPVQKEAAAHRGKAFLLEAGPGTGKTQTLTARVEGLLDDGVAPRRILLLTFSNKAAREMAERIAVKRKEAAAAMWIGTFHAFGLDLVRRFHRELRLPKDPRMMDRTEAVELLEREFPRLSLVHYGNLYDPTQNIADILSAISRAKDEVVDHKKYAELAAEMRKKAVTPESIEAAERASEVARVYETYETLKLEANCIDFGDLVSMPVRLLEQNELVRAHLQAEYDHVLVDEYQDVNRSSIRLLSALCGSGENLWVVGDSKQSIYRFRGASSFNMTRFGTEDFADGSRKRLKRNYRSVSEIVEAFSGFAMGMKAGNSDSGLESDRGSSKKKPELQMVTQAEQQSVALADAIEAMRGAGSSYSEQAVLCTGNEKLASLAQDLERLGIPVLYLGSLFERQEVKDLLAFLTLLTDRRAMGLVRVACWPEFQMSFEDVAVVLKQLRAGDPTSAIRLRNVECFSGVSSKGRTALTDLVTALAGFEKSDSPWTVLAKLLLDRARITARIARSPAAVERTQGLAIWQLMNFVRVQPAARGLPITRLLERIRRLLRLGDDRDLRQLPAAAQAIDAVKLMTIHGAKGLEFSVVHLPSLNSDTIPRSPQTPPCPPPDGMIAGGQGTALDIFRSGHAEEQECLFYVALSRARDRLFLYAPTQKSDGKKRAVSPFLDRLGAFLDRRQVTPERILPSAPEAAEIQISVQGALRFTGQQMALYDLCPRRFFYTHVLQIGGRRTTTAFLQMHEAVRTVYQATLAGTATISNENELEQRLDEALSAQKLSDHGYVNHYKAFAVTMLRYFVSSRQGLTSERPIALSLKFGDEEIIVQPDDVLVRPDGMRTLRAIRTGHQRSEDLEDLGAAAFILAARGAFPDAVVELIYLSDEASLPISLSPKKLQNRHDKLIGYLQEIRKGRFPAETNNRVCPSCPAFFICGPTPGGSLQKKF